MKRFLLFLAALIMLVQPGTCESIEEENKVEFDFFGEEEVWQVVYVEYKGGSNAVVSFYEKAEGDWICQRSEEGYVGKKGMGKTKEGDGKTPLGVYNLTTPFGILDDPGASMEYLKVTKNHYWCATSKSPYYNQLVDSSETGTKPSSSDEILYKYAGSYDYCMFVDYNKECVPGAGSCIFLHCTGKNPYTAGCIAVDEDFMKEIIIRAQEGIKIVLADSN